MFDPSSRARIRKYSTVKEVHIPLKVNHKCQRLSTGLSPWN